MQLKAFRIRNFRSIIDSGWIPFSPDGITVFVGQNESGKTSVLDALHCGLSNVAPTSDDYRTGEPQPEVHFRTEVESVDIVTPDEDINEFEESAIIAYLESCKNLVEVQIEWEPSGVGADSKMKAVPTCNDPRLNNLLDTAALSTRSNETKESSILNPESSRETQVAGTTIAVSASTGASSASARAPFTADDFAIAIWRAIPYSVSFREENGRLPDVVDIDDKGNPTGPGASAANNFLSIAEINLPQLLADDKRARENKLNRANSSVSKDFNEFWSQTIGKDGRLALKCEIDNYPDTAAIRPGKAHLVFWICDGNTQLYPKQRSQGVRWFISFYLQLKASEKAGNRRVFLLDEPGANLHSKAQGDVLKLVNKLAKDKSTVIYTTHSPQMVEHTKLFRVHAVQRDGDQDDSPTRIIDAHRLGAASTDTLSPVLAAMGADLSQHQVVRRFNNVILEEMSGYYYISAFWILAGAKNKPHLIAATGVNKIEVLANMFKGWGLDFVVAVDDDKQGREVYKSIKREHFGDDDALAKSKLIKLPNGTGIEDTFSSNDFKRFVLDDSAAAISGTNSEYLKTASRSKPVLAFNFFLAVESQKISMELLDSTTQANIKNCVNSIDSLLMPE